MASPALNVSPAPKAIPPTHKSTGPRTPEGKARSSQNAKKHGFSAKTLDVLPAEQADFDVYQNELLETIKPQPGPQSDLFHQLLHAGWTLRRLVRFELEILENGNPFESAEAQIKLDRLERYRAGHRRAYTRILDEIRKLQTDDMIWSTAHSFLQDAKKEMFPMANPGSRPLQSGMARLGERIETRKLEQAIALPPEALDARLNPDSTKTNSPESAARCATS